jgi:hypothetical protein
VQVEFTSAAESPESPGSPEPSAGETAEAS